MKKIIFILLFNLACAQPLLPPIEVNTIVDSALNLYKNAGAKAVRYVTDTQTPKEKCNNAYFKYYHTATDAWWKIYHENEGIKQVLKQHNISTKRALKERFKSASIDLYKMKEISCSEKYFNMVYSNTLKLHKKTEENRILKELLTANNIPMYKKEKTLYQRIGINKKKEKERRKSKEQLKAELLKAMQDVN